MNRLTLVCLVASTTALSIHNQVSDDLMNAQIEHYDMAKVAICNP